MLKPWVVVKFGGTSVSGLKEWQAIAQVIQKHLSAGVRVLLVCSAAAGVSNQLEAILEKVQSSEIPARLQAVIDLYQTLVRNLGVAVDLSAEFESLSRLIEGLCLTGEVTPRIRAKVLSFGELLLTRIGAAYLLDEISEAVHWQDARDWLLAEAPFDYRHPDAYLNARCDSDKDDSLIQQLTALPAPVVITQGFIARNAQRETVLLGRGGSDSSAAYLSAKIGALACEIWTDVPGIYTANPKDIPQARLLSELEYEEAQEIASMGAKVLHPKCISPVRRANIPLLIKFTAQPNREGTTIAEVVSSSAPQIKSILTKQDVILIAIETFTMWHQVGFLSKVFDTFKQHGVSIDLISTSESSVTVSLDSQQHLKTTAMLDGVLADLNQFARAKLISGCASVSLVGRQIRAILHQLGGVFSVFEEKKIYLLSQAANDLNLTFVLDQEEAPRLAAKLHHLLIEQAENSHAFHLSWQEEFGELPERPVAWWQKDRDRLLQLSQAHAPAYVYSEAVLRKQADALLACDAVDGLYYSMKANHHPNVLKTFYDRGLGFECVSVEELTYLLSLFPDMDKKRISFTPNFAAKAEYEHALSLGVNVTLDSVYPFEHWGELFAGQAVLIRVDLGRGRGHHRYVVTGGDQSKFGIPLGALGKVSLASERFDIKIKGLHSHAGSGILNPLHWQGVFNALVELLPRFPDVRILNMGGGLGVPERPGQLPLALDTLNDSLQPLTARHPELAVWLEPGRYLVSEAGVLMARVTQIKRKGGLTFVGIDTGMNSLIRPALYGAYHDIVNLTRLGEPLTQLANVVGPICETGDTLGYSRRLPVTEEGDVLLIANAGAYGRVMASHYNLRVPAKEHWLSEK